MSFTVSPTPSPGPAAYATVKVYNSAGEEVRVVHDQLGLLRTVSGVRVLESGFVPDQGGVATILLAGPEVSVAWDGTGSDGQRVLSGSYNVVVEIKDRFGSTTLYSSGVTVVRTDDRVLIKVYNSAGEMVRMATAPGGSKLGGLGVSAESFVAGSGSLDIHIGDPGSPVFTWDGSQSDGNAVASGVYQIEAFQMGTGNPAVYKRTVLVLNAPADALGPLLMAPNPVRGAQRELSILSQGGAVPLRLEAKIYNLAGELVQELGAQPGTTSLRWVFERELAGGIYLVSVRRDLAGRPPRWDRLKLAIVR